MLVEKNTKKQGQSFCIVLIILEILNAQELSCLKRTDTAGSRTLFCNSYFLTYRNFANVPCSYHIRNFKHSKAKLL